MNIPIKGLETIFKSWWKRLLAASRKVEIRSTETTLRLVKVVDYISNQSWMLFQDIIPARSSCYHLRTSKNQLKIDVSIIIQHTTCTALFRSFAALYISPSTRSWQAVSGVMFSTKNFSQWF